MEVEVAVQGSPSLIVRTVSVDVKQHHVTEQSSGAVWKDEVAVLIVLRVSVDVKQHRT